MSNQLEVRTIEEGIYELYLNGNLLDIDYDGDTDDFAEFMVNLAKALGVEAFITK